MLTSDVRELLNYNILKKMNTMSPPTFYFQTVLFYTRGSGFYKHKTKKAYVVRAMCLLRNSEEYLFTKKKSENKGFRLVEKLHTA